MSGMEIRYAPGVLGVAGLLAPRAAVEYALDLERAKIRAAVMVPRESLPAVTAEVEHRRGLKMTERDAWESVGDDLRAGRWEP